MCLSATSSHLLSTSRGGDSALPVLDNAFAEEIFPNLLSKPSLAKLEAFHPNARASGLPFSSHSLQSDVHIQQHHSRKRWQHQCSSSAAARAAPAHAGDHQSLLLHPKLQRLKELWLFQLQQNQARNSMEKQHSEQGVREKGRMCCHHKHCHGGQPEMQLLVGAQETLPRDPAPHGGTRGTAQPLQGEDEHVWQPLGL